MMRKTFGILCLMLATGPAAALTVNLLPSNSNPVVGSLFSIQIALDDAGLIGDEVLAFGFDILDPDPAVATLLSWSVATPFNDDSSLLPDAQVAGSTFPGLTDASFSLATLNFQATGAGMTNIGIESDTGNPNQGLIYLLQGNRDISSSLLLEVEASIIPAPSALMLLPIGILGLVIWNKGHVSSPSINRFRLLNIILNLSTLRTLT